MKHPASTCIYRLIHFDPPLSLKRKLPSITPNLCQVEHFLCVLHVLCPCLRFSPQRQPLSNVMGRLDNRCEAKIFGHWSRPSFSQRAACMALLRLVSQGSGDKNVCDGNNVFVPPIFLSPRVPPFPVQDSQPDIVVRLTSLPFLFPSLSFCLFLSNKFLCS